MRSRTVLTSLLFWTCAASPKPIEPAVCITRCGLHVVARTNTCPKAKALELEVLRAIARDVTQFTPDDMCEAERNWVVVTHTYTKSDGEMCTWPAWWDGYTECVVGYAHRDINIIETTNEDWLHNALAHELMHAAQIYKLRGDGHCHWKKLGILKALREVTGQIDKSESEPACAHAVVLNVEPSP